MVGQSGTHKPLALNDGFHSKEQFFFSVRLNDIAVRTRPQSRRCHICGLFLGKENDFGLWGHFANLFSGLDSVQLWKADIQQNQVRLQLLRFTNRISAVRTLTHDLQSGIAFELRCYEASPRLKVIHSKDPEE